VQLCLLRGVGRCWLYSPGLIAELAAGILATGAIAFRAWRFGLSVFRLTVFKDVNFTLAAIYNFMTSGLVFLVVVFLPAMGEGPLGYTATVAGFAIVPRAILLMLMMLFVGELVGRIDYRILLSTGWILMASGFAILSRIQPSDGLIWMVIGSTVQAAGAGLLFTPHSTVAFSTLAPELRTDASGLYSLVRQLGFAFSVALMTAVLQVRIDANLPGVSSLLPSASAEALTNMAGLQAYQQCFAMLSLVSLLVIPGVFFFRFGAMDAVPKEAA